jgi:TP901 family phage tail tape measure protein
MSDRVQFSIQTTLNKPTSQDIQKVKKDIEKQIQTININTSTNSKGIKLLDTKEIDNYKKHMENMMQNLRTRYGKLLDGNDVKSQVNEFNRALSGFGKNGLSKNDINLQFETLSTNVKKTSGALRLATQDADTLGNVLMKDVQKFGLWFGIGTVFMSIVHSIQGMISTVYELDTAMINLRKVTDETEDTYKSFLRTSNDTAKSLAVSTVQVIDATTAWVKAGYTLSQAQELAKSTLIGSNVGDISVDEMQSFLVAPLKAYNMEAKDSIDLVSKMNNISNKHAITIQDLGEAYNRASSVMALANNSIDEFTALVTAAQAQTQMGGDVIGNAFRTIALRIISMKDEEGKAIPQMEDDLRKFGVALKDVDGNLLSTFNIIGQLNKAFATNAFSQEEQLALLEKLAGKRQVNILAATIDNFSEAQKSLNDSINAGSSALDEQAKYLNSIEAKVKQFKESTVGMWNNFLSSDVIKFTVDFGTALITLVDKVGVLATGVAGLLIYLGLAGKLQMITIFNGWAIAIGRLTLSLTGSAVAASALATAFSILAPVAIVAGIVGLVKVFDAFTISLKEQREIVNKLNTEIADLESQYNKLKNTTDRTTEQENYLGLLERELEIKKELQNIETRKLIQIEFFEGGSDLGGATGIGNISESIYGKGQSGQIKKYIDDLKKLREELSNATTLKDYDEINEKILNIEQSLITSRKSIQAYIDAGNDVPPELLQIADSIDAVITKAKEQEDAINKAGDAFESSLKFGNAAEAIKTLQDIRESTEDLSDALAEYKDEGKFSSETLLELISKYPELIRYLGSEKELYEQISKKLKDKTTDTKKAFNDELTSLEKTINEKAKGYVNDLKNWKSMEEAKLKITQDMLNQVNDMYNKTLTATGDTETAEISAMKFAKRLKEKLNAVLPDISNYIDLKQFNVEKLLTPDSKSKSSKKDSINDILKDEQKFQNEITKMENLSKDLLNEEYDQRLKNLDLEKKANEELIKYYESMRATAKAKGLEEELNQKILATQSDLQNIEKERKEINKDIAESIKKQAEEEKKLREEQKKQAKELIDSYQQYIIDGIEKEIDKLEESKKKAKEVAQVKIDAINAEIAKLEDRNDEIREAEEREQKLLDLAKAREKLANIRKERNVQVYKEGQGFVWSVDPKAEQEAMENLQDIEKDYYQWESENARNRQVEALKAQIKSIEDQLKKDEEGYDKRIEAYKKFIKDQEDALKASGSEQITSLDQLLEKLSTMEADSYSERLAQLQSFLNARSDLIRQINSMAISDIAVKDSATNTVKQETKTTTTTVTTTPKKSTSYQNYEQFDTGGKTVGEGLAYLHDKEIVLNKLDSVNFLEAIKLTRDIFKGIQIPNFSKLTPSLAGVPSTVNHYSFPNMTVEANDGEQFIKSLRTIIRTS